MMEQEKTSETGAENFSEAKCGSGHGHHYHGGCCRHGHQCGRRIIGLVVLVLVIGLLVSLAAGFHEHQRFGNERFGRGEVRCGQYYGQNFNQGGFRGMMGGYLNFNQTGAPLDSQPVYISPNSSATQQEKGISQPTTVNPAQPIFPVKPVK